MSHYIACLIYKCYAISQTSDIVDMYSRDSSPSRKFSKRKQNRDILSPGIIMHSQIHLNSDSHIYVQTDTYTCTWPNAIAPQTCDISDTVVHLRPVNPICTVKNTFYSIICKI